MLKGQDCYAVSRVCGVIGLPRSCYYHKKHDRGDQALRAAIEAIVGEFPTYGSRRVTAQLWRAPYGMIVNRKRVQRVMRPMGLVRPRRRRTYRTTASAHPFARYPNLVNDLGVTAPDQVWVGDIPYVHLREEFVCLAVLMDVFTRAIRGWNLSRSLDQALTLTALRRALARRVPSIPHSDQGIHYAATAYVEFLLGHQVQISMAAVGNPQENGYAERLLRTIKEEEVELSDYTDFADAYAQIGHFLEEVYQKKQIHSALGYLTPVEFEEAWRQDHAELESPPKSGVKCVQL